MGKKNKNKSQKNRQSKNLKKRTQKKLFKKQKPKSQAQLPLNMAGKIPGGMTGPVKQMAEFAEPLILMANPANMEDMQKAVGLSQAFWKTFAEQDLRKRAQELELLKTSYQDLNCTAIDFDKFAQYMLKRHIHFLPSTHNEDELNRYSAEEIRMAVEKPLVPPEESPQAPDTLGPEIDPQAVLNHLGAEEHRFIMEMYRDLKENHVKINFDNPDNSQLPKTIEFQKRVIDIFKRYLSQIIQVKDPGTYLANLVPFFDTFLIETKRSHIFACNAGLVEEYMLDFYFRKMKPTPESEDLLVFTFVTFFVFAEKMGYMDNTESIVRCINESQAEYEELLQDKRKA